jgi:hypothetical protein
MWSKITSEHVSYVKDVGTAKGNRKQATCIMKLNKE